MNITKEFKVTDWIFNMSNKNHNLPFIKHNDYLNIIQSLSMNRVDDRIRRLESFGFTIKRCYIPNYNGVGEMTYMPRLNEVRLVIGRPKNHFCKEVYAVIIK
jgi:hypothetical protein